MRILAKLCALAAFIAVPAGAQECDPSFVDSSTTVQVAGVNVGDGEVSIENFNVRVRNDGNGQCSATMRVARLGGSGTATPLQYALRSGPNRIDILPNEGLPGTTESDFLVGGIPGGRNGRAVPFVLTVPTGWGLEAGFYSEQFLLTLLGPGGEPLDTMIVTFEIAIPPSVSMRIVGATGNDPISSINLGEISNDQPTVSDPFGIRVWSTSPYLVSFRSENGGALAHERTIDRIPYELRMDNVVVDLVGGTEILVPDIALPLGTVHRLRVEVGPAAARAGNYVDRVTVTVTAV